MHRRDELVPRARSPSRSRASARRRRTAPRSRRAGPARATGPGRRRVRAGGRRLPSRSTQVSVAPSQIGPSASSTRASSSRSTVTGASLPARVPAMAEQRVGVIGLGNMGGRIAARIAAAGRTVAGYDTDASRAPALGIEAAASVAALVGARRCRAPVAAGLERGRAGRRGSGRHSRRRAGGPGRRRPEHLEPELDGAPRGAPGRARRGAHRRRDLGRRGRGREGDADDHGGRRPGRARGGARRARDLQHARRAHGRVRFRAHDEAAEQLPQRGDARGDRRGDGRRAARGTRPAPGARGDQLEQRRELREPASASPTSSRATTSRAA